MRCVELEGAVSFRRGRNLANVADAKQNEAKNR